MEPGWSNMRPRWIKMGHAGRRSHTKEAGREKEEATRKETKQNLYIQTPDQPLLAAPYYLYGIHIRFLKQKNPNNL